MKKNIVVLITLLVAILVAGNVNAFDIGNITLLHPERTHDQFRPGAFFEVTGSGFTCSGGGGRFIPVLYFTRDTSGAYDSFVMFLEVISRTDTYLKLRLSGFDSYSFNNDANAAGSISALDEETRDAINRRRLDATLQIHHSCSGGLTAEVYSRRITVAPPPLVPEVYELSLLDVVAGRFFWIYGSGFNNNSQVAYVGRDGVAHELEGYFESSTFMSAYFPETTARAVYTIYVRNPSGERSARPSYVESNGIGINVLAKLVAAPRELQMMRRPPTVEIHPVTGTVMTPAPTGGSDDKKKK